MKKSILIVLFLSTNVFAQKNPILKKGSLSSDASKSSILLKTRRMPNLDKTFDRRKTLDSLRYIIHLEKGDINQINALLAWANYNLVNTEYLYNMVNKDSSVAYINKAFLLSQKLNYVKGEAYCYFLLAASLNDSGNYSQTLALCLKSFRIYERLNDKEGMAAVILFLQGTYREIGDYENALLYEYKGKKLFEPNDMKAVLNYKGYWMTPLIYMELASTYLEMNQLDSASFYTYKAIDRERFYYNGNTTFPTQLLGIIQERQGKYKEALVNYRQAISLAIEDKFSKDTADIYNCMAGLYIKTHQLDSAIFYAKRIVTTWNNTWPLNILLTANATVAEAYKLKGVADSSLKYIENRDILKDSLFSQQKQKDIHNATFNEQLNQQALITAQKDYEKKVQIYFLLAGLGGLLLLAALLWRHNKHREKSYHLLENQKKETENQKAKVEHTLKELRATQTQLIQSEKLASLGELTAGIAHEIQNPLNFVNNFSELSVELAQELKEAAEKPEMDKELILDLANDLTENQEKINLHGKRASSIVKGMLEHSRTSTGEKELTDINSLADEYLRLAYHGLRAKDKDFNSDFKTDFDPNLPKIAVIPQDIGRVLLNLINNAFWAVKTIDKPLVVVKTEQSEYQIIITVKDNGTGMPDDIKAKIFQPFFTTKPTGQGTGLGLSLAYDIVTKGHGGTIECESVEGEGTDFIVKLPIV
jgi:two-component system NtrC family sensor kinase